MTLGWPEGIYLALVLIGLGVSLTRDGQPKTGTHSFFENLMSTVLIVALLYWGGFFE